MQLCTQISCAQTAAPATPTAAATTANDAAMAAGGGDDWLPDMDPGGGSCAEGGTCESCYNCFMYDNSAHGGAGCGCFDFDLSAAECTGGYVGCEGCHAKSETARVRNC